MHCAVKSTVKSSTLAALPEIGFPAPTQGPSHNSHNCLTPAPKDPTLLSPPWKRAHRFTYARLHIHTYNNINLFKTLHANKTKNIEGIKIYMSLLVNLNHGTSEKFPL